MGVQEEGGLGPPKAVFFLSFFSIRFLSSPFLFAWGEGLGDKEVPLGPANGRGQGMAII